MKEIIYPKKEIKETEFISEKCYCGGNLYYTQIPCPDGMEGCLAIHYGYRCESCGKIFQ
jgi:hypothetical protein